MQVIRVKHVTSIWPLATKSAAFFERPAALMELFDKIQKVRWNPFLKLGGETLIAAASAILESGAKN